MVIYGGLFPPIASINIAATDLRTMLNEKNAGRFSPRARIRNVCISKHFLAHMDNLATRRRVFVAKEREKNGRYPNQSFEHSK